MEAVPLQVQNFLITVLSGIVIGILFDGYRLLRGILLPKVLATGIGDLLFCLVVTMFVFCALILINWGELRSYIFIGLIIGFVIHNRFFSRHILRLFGVLIYYIRKICVFLKMVLWTPLVFMFRVLLFPWRWLYNKLSRQVIPTGLKAGGILKQAVLKRCKKPPDPSDKPPANPPS